MTAPEVATANGEGVGVEVELGDGNFRGSVLKLLLASAPSSGLLGLTPLSSMEGRTSPPVLGAPPDKKRRFE